MSGLEIAGVALAVVPILFSASERYVAVHRSFDRLFKFSQEVKRYCLQLKTHSTIFREECRLLLGHVVADDEVVEMLNRSSHPLWKDENVENGLVELLSTSREACINTVSMVRTLLEEIEHEVHELCKIAAKEPKEEQHSKSWHLRVQKRISFSLSDRLDRNLTKLKDLNQDFRFLTDQIFKLEERRPSGASSITRQQFKALQQFRLIQKASNFLYESLGAACTKHTEHVAHFCLEPDLEDESSPRVRFRIAFRHLSVTSTASVFQDPIWFAVESIIKDSLAGNSAGVCETLTDLSNSLKRRTSSSPQLDCRKRPKKSVRLVSPTRSPSLIVPPLTSMIPNLCVHRNFCNQIQQYLNRAFADKSPFVGLLEERSECRHLVHLPLSTPSLKDRSTSLANVFVSISKRNLQGGIPIYERLRLARLLATAVLQFHATPWLTGSWRSEDVLFYGIRPEISDPTRASMLSSPYMQVSIRGPTDPLSRLSNSSYRTFAPNPILHGLGVMFLELAYEAPLHNLQRPIDLENGKTDQYTDFFVAKRLSRSASSQMGPRYNNIIRKCLQCDFDCGDDLSQPELQERFYRKVVCELNTLEEEFRKLQLGS